MTGGPLQVVRIETGRDFAPVVETGLELLGIRMVSWHDRESGRVVFEEFHDTVARARERLSVLDRHLEQWSAGEEWTTQLHEMAPQDWSESWKRFFRPERVSPRLVVKPSWEDYAAAAGVHTVEIDPGLCFGTGQHATTRACLRLLDQYGDACEDRRFLDLGCGTGILSIAAAKLGFGHVAAIDRDAAAISIAEGNCSRNHVSERVSCRVQDLRDFTVSERFGVVAANLFADVLVRFASTLAGALSERRGSLVILSGILTPQYGRIRRTYEALGLGERRRITDGEWTSGCFGPSAT